MKCNTDAQQPSVAAVIVCGGKGERTGLPYNKVLHLIGQKTVLETSIDKFVQAGVPHITVVAASDDAERIRDIVKPYAADCISVSVVLGGNTRAQSVFNGLKAYPCDIVAIHDGARPFVTPELIIRTVRSAIDFGSGIAAVRSTDTVKRVTPNGTVTSIPRSELYNAQTPQTFNYKQILDAYSAANAQAFTDDSEVYAAAGYSPKLVDGEYTNIKITTATDLVKCVPNGSRIGIGFDVHRLIEGRQLILGGVNIPFERGLDGHSDADVLTHAIMDALLSAANSPDIGVLFPDTDDRFLGISSLVLLEKVMDVVKSNGYSVQNVSAVIAAQRPKLAKIIPDIRASLAKAMGIEIDRVNVSATTTERLGLIGSGDAIAANACCILLRDDQLC